LLAQVFSTRTPKGYSFFRAHVQDFDFSFAVVWIPSIIFLFLTIAALHRIEVWPITGVPMYSQYISLSAPRPKDGSEASQRAKAWLISGYPITLMWIDEWNSLLLVNGKVIRSTTELRKFAADVINLGTYAMDPKYKFAFYRRYWNRTVCTVTALSCSGNMKYAEDWLSENIDVWRSLNWKLPHWEKDAEIWLVLHLASEDQLLAKLKWHY